MTKNKPSFPATFSNDEAFVDGLKIESTKERIVISGNMNLTADEAGLSTATRWSFWCSNIMATASKAKLPTTRVDAVRTYGPIDTNRSPFADKSFSIEGLTLEGAADHLAIYGNLEISYNQHGSEIARDLARIFGSVVVELKRRAERGQLPQAIKIDVPVIKANPLA